MAAAQPNVKELYNEYIEAFNAKDYERISRNFSKDLIIYVFGKLSLDRDFVQLEKNYREHWAMPGCRVTILELDELDEEEGVGVVTKIIDHARNKIVRVKYFYREEDGKWLQIKHDIFEATAAEPDVAPAGSST